MKTNENRKWNPILWTEWVLDNFSLHYNVSMFLFTTCALFHFLSLYFCISVQRRKYLHVFFLYLFQTFQEKYIEDAMQNLVFKFHLIQIYKKRNKSNSSKCVAFSGISWMRQPGVVHVAARKCCQYSQIRHLHFWPHPLWNVNLSVRSSRQVASFVYDTYLNALWVLQQYHHYDESMARQSPEQMT